METKIDKLQIYLKEYVYNFGMILDKQVEAVSRNGL